MFKRRGVLPGAAVAGTMTRSWKGAGAAAVVAATAAVVLAAGGSLDAGFGSAGIVTEPGATYGQSWDLEAQPDGRIVQLGFAETGQANEAGIATGGWGTFIDLPGNTHGHALALAPDGGILLGGQSDWTWCIAKYTRD